MARTDSDSWDLASSVGTTATMVAAARALASVEADPLITDPFAADLVRAVGIDFFTRLVDGRIDELDGAADHVVEVERMVASLAVRTRFFDEFFLDAFAADGGSRQAVILAAGLDARAYRLDCTSCITVYEVVHKEVVYFKTRALAELGAQARAERRTVGVDLREDWPKALRAAGFDVSAPSAWSAEGLLMYLPPDAQDRLFDDITALSAPGSRLATEMHADAGRKMAERAKALTNQWQKYGYDLDMTKLFYTGERHDVAEYLRDRGWEVTARPRRELYAEYGRVFPEDDPLAAFRNVVSVTAVRV